MVLLLRRAAHCGHRYPWDGAGTTFSAPGRELSSRDLLLGGLTDRWACCHSGAMISRTHRRTPGFGPEERGGRGSMLVDEGDTAIPGVAGLRPTVAVTPCSSAGSARARSAQQRKTPATCQSLPDGWAAGRLGLGGVFGGGGLGQGPGPVDRVPGADPLALPLLLPSQRGRTDFTNTPSPLLFPEVGGLGRCRRRGPGEVHRTRL